MGVSSIDWGSTYRKVEGWVSASVARDDIADIVQDVMLSLSPMLADREREPEVLLALLRKITRCRVADHYRRKGVEFISLVGDEAGEHIDPLVGLGSDEMLRVLMRLPTKEREVLYFHLWLGMGFAEISRNRGLRYPLSSVALRSRYRRAIAHFAFELSGGVGNPVDISAAKSLMPRICALPDCGRSFVPSWKGRKRIFCSDGCAQKPIERKEVPEAYFERECAIDGCNVRFKPSRSGRNGLQKYCSDAHKSKAYRLRKKLKEKRS